MINLNLETLFMAMPFVAMLVGWIITGLKSKNKLYWIGLATINLLWIAYGIHKSDVAICLDSIVSLGIIFFGMRRTA